MKNIIAITGPSGIGKTTLGNLLIKNNGFITPLHTTTRDKRLDDIDGFYRYLSFEQFKNYAKLDEFLFWTGDNEIIDKKFGNYYGILKNDFYEVEDCDRIIIYVSYKDILSLMKLKKIGLNINVVNLVYSNLPKNLPKRLLDSGRDCTNLELKKRLASAIEYENKFRNIVESYDGIIIIPNDISSIDETYSEVVRKLVKGK